jgi:hypothetical protein
MKNQDSPIRMADPDWIKRGQWDLNVESLERFFIVIGAGVDANVKVLSGWFEKPVAQKIPDWLLIELVDFLDENKKNFPVPVEVRSKYNKLTKVTEKPKVKKIERRRVLSKKNPQDLPSRVKKLFAQIDHKTAKALNVPKTPSIGGASPGRALKPAVFDPTSVDIDNDGWHQEGTTAAWFGAGLNNPILVGIKESLDALSDEDRASAYQTMTSLGNFGNFAGAPLPEDSTPEADLSWLAGKMTLARQGGPPRPDWGGKEEFPLESQWLLGRNEARRRKGIQQEILPIPEIEQLDEGEILATLDKAAEARKQRRAVADSKMRVNAGDSISDDALQAAKSFDAEDYPQDESVETLPEAEWIEKNFGERPETPEYQSDWTPEEIEAYNESVEAKMTWLADSYDAYILYTRDQERLRDAALLEAVSKIYDFEFTGNDGKKYSTKVESAVNSVTSSSTIMKGKFYDDAGKEVGVFERTFHFGEGIVAHDLLVLNPEVRGSQISGIFNSRNEIAYRAMGFHTIGAGAASGAQFNGSTHWPKVGFDWADEDERSGFLSAVEDAVVEFAVALKDDPDSLPMVAKIIENEDSSTTVVNIPIFASREEAESIAMLLTLSRSQDFDAEDRLTAGDFVNWSGAEAFFQQRGVSVELTRSIGGSGDSANVPDAVSDAPEVNAPEADIATGALTPEEIEKKNEEILKTIQEFGGDFGSAHPDMEKRKSLPDGSPDKHYGTLVTTEERTERRREVMKQTLSGLKIYLETGDAEKAMEVGNWDKGIWDENQDSMSFYMGTSLKAYDQIDPKLKELILNSSEDELIAVIEESILDFVKGYRDGEIGMAVPSQRLLTLLDDGDYKTAAVIEEGISRGDFDSSLRSTASAAGTRMVYEETIGISMDAPAEVRPASAFISHPEVENVGMVDMYGDMRMIMRPEVKGRVAIVRGDPLGEKSHAVKLDTDDDDALVNAFLNYQYEGDRKGERVVARMIAALEAKENGDKSNMMKISERFSEYAEVYIPGSIEMGEVASIDLRYLSIDMMVSSEERQEIVDSLDIPKLLKDAGAPDEVIQEVEEHFAKILGDFKDLPLDYKIGQGIKGLVSMEVLKRTKEKAATHGITEVGVSNRYGDTYNLAWLSLDEKEQIKRNVDLMIEESIRRAEEKTKKLDDDGWGIG